MLLMPLNNSTLMVAIVIMLFMSIAASSAVKRQYNKYSGQLASSGLTGGEAARRILESEGIYDVRVERVDGRLTDHYDPRNMVLRLSSETMDGQNVAAISVAAHETGHALQHRDAYAPLMLRNACVASVGIGSQAAWPIFIIGLIFSLPALVYAGIALYAIVVMFTLITLPVELNASSRALGILSSGGYLAAHELPGARKVLKAAASTYVISAAMAILQLLRLIVIARGGRRRD